MNRCKRNGQTQDGPRFLSHSGKAARESVLPRSALREKDSRAHSGIGHVRAPFFFFCVVRSEVHRRRDIISIYSFSSASLG